MKSEWNKYETVYKNNVVCMIMCVYVCVCFTSFIIPAKWDKVQL